MNLVPLHKALLERLPAAMDLWSLTTSANPVAVLGWGQPVPLSSEPGYVICAAECRSTLGALAWMTERLSDPSLIPLLFPGWQPPFAHVIALERSSMTTLSIVGWSAMAQDATLGFIQRAPHPEVPDDINLVRVHSASVIQSRRDMTLTLIANLAHLDVFLPGLT